MISRRTVVGAAGGLGATAASAKARPLPAPRAPKGFLWGVAGSAHQTEGNNVNSDAWLMENVTPTLFKDRSGDACDSYHRFAEDIALTARLGFNTYRFGIEWARIEPSEGRFSTAELDHYAKVLEACHAHALKPIVTYSHFTMPRWFAERGGFEASDSPDLFARFADKTTRRLGPLMGMASTFNEANIPLLLRFLPEYANRRPEIEAMLAAARKATGSERFSNLLFADASKTEANLIAAHRKAFAAIKAARGDLPVGVTLSMQDVQAQGAGAEKTAEFVRHAIYGGWIEAAKTHADYVGVQTYTRVRVGPAGPLPPAPGQRNTASGYEDYPQALAGTIRYAHKAIGKPIHVTENGISTDDDARRIGFIDEALAGVRACMDEGIDVRSYIYWSLLDNFEWTSGYGQHFGLVAVDLDTFARRPKPSALHLGARARRNAI